MFLKRKKKFNRVLIPHYFTTLLSTNQGKQQPPSFQEAAATPNQKTILVLFEPYTFDPTQTSIKQRLHLPSKSVNHSKQRMESMSKIVNQMLDITKDMPKSIARVQDSWDQMKEVLDK